MGGHEYLLVYGRPSMNGPRPELAHDGALFSGALPWLYSLWAKRVPGAAPFGAGDRFTFGRVRPAERGVDCRMLDLAPLPLSDPAVASAYTDIVWALDAINRGTGLPNACTGQTAVLASLVSATAQPGAAEIEWDVEGAPSVQVQRRAPGDGWQVRGEAAVTGRDRVRWTDTDVVRGARYGYRLALGEGGAAPYAGEAWVVIPATTKLALAGFAPGSGSGSASVRFALPGSGRAEIQVFDVAGRRALVRDVTAFGPGAHAIPLGASLAPGVYWLRLSQGGESASARGVLLH